MCRLLRELRMREESKDAQPVIETDDNYAFLCEVGAVLSRFRSGARGEAAAINPNHDGQPGTRRSRRRPHIQV